MQICCLSALYQPDIQLPFREELRARPSFPFIHIALALRLSYQPYATKYQDEGQALCPLQHTNAHQHTNRYRHNRLHIIVDTNHRGAKCFLSNHDEAITNKGANHHHVCRFEPRSSPYLCPRQGCNMRSSEWQKQQRGPKEHPLADRYHRIATHKGIEKREIKGVRKLRSKAK